MPSKKLLYLHQHKKLFLALAVLTLLSLFFLRRHQARAVPVRTGTVTRKSVQDSYTEEGVLSGGRQYTLFSEVSGPVQRIAVRENQTVTPGTLLYIIDSQDYLYQKEQLKSERSGLEAQKNKAEISRVMTLSPEEYIHSLAQQADSAEAALTAAQTRYAAAGELLSSGAISRNEYEELHADFEMKKTAAAAARERHSESRKSLLSLKSSGMDDAALNEQFYSSDTRALAAQIEAMDIRLRQLGESIEKCVVRADRAGIVSSLPLSGSSYLSAGSPALTLDVTDTLCAEADVLTAVAPFLSKGTPVTIRLVLRGSEEIYSGEIAEIYDYATCGRSALGTAEYRVHIKVALPEETQLALKNKSGYGVLLSFCPYSAENVLTVPGSAVFSEAQQSYVYTISNGRAVKTPVELSYRTVSDAVILSGLNEGDTVISYADNEGLCEGARVRRMR